MLWMFDLSIKIFYQKAFRYDVKTHRNFGINAIYENSAAFVINYSKTTLFFFNIPCTLATSGRLNYN